MFTGIIKEIGIIQNVSSLGDGKRLEIAAQKILEDLKIDDSVAVNGVCLTVTAFYENSFIADAVPETLAKTTLGSAEKKQPVNLEPALRLQDRLGGHLVQGHVDCTAVLKSLTVQRDHSLLIIEIPAEFERYTISKGSIAIDGVSLTIARKEKSRLTIALIPHTLKRSTLHTKTPGELVNIEV
ncbi:MAG: riboflavin synthase, partial [bacterium]|nr:riboflavin synthase [bacterium]